MSNITAGQTDTIHRRRWLNRHTQRDSATATPRGKLAERSQWREHRQQPDSSVANGVNIYAATLTADHKQRRFDGQPKQLDRPAESGMQCHAVRIQQWSGPNGQQHLLQHGQHDGNASTAEQRLELQPHHDRHVCRTRTPILTARARASRHPTTSQRARNRAPALAPRRPRTDSMRQRLRRRTTGVFVV